MLANFSQRDLTGTVRTLRSFAGSEWTIVDLTNGQTATGEFEEGEIQVGVSYRFFGTWQEHPRFGPQFRIESWVVAPGQNEAGIVNYLSRGGVGLTRSEAVKLYKVFGAETLEVLRDNPGTVGDTGIIDSHKADVAQRALECMRREEPARIALFELFAGRSFPRGVVKACLREWGLKAPEIVRRDPFKMIVKEISGVGFKRADGLYLDLGHNPKRIKRAMFAGWHWMRTNGSGNTWELSDAVRGKICAEVDHQRVDRALQLGIRGKWFAERDGYLAERVNAANERKLVAHLCRILKHKPTWPTDLDPALSEHQAEQLRPLLTAGGVAILAGTPGTGKTFSAAALIRGVLRQRRWARIRVCAPTGKAAVRITEAMQRYSLPLQATTIHSLLQCYGHSNGKPEFRRDELNPLVADLIVVDETSMCDTDLMAALFAAVPAGCNVLLIGDPFQLPPVGHGAPLRDMLAAGIPSALLTEIKRNAGTIVTACRDIKDGAMFQTVERIDEEAGDNLAMTLATTPADQEGTVLNLMTVLRAKGYDPIWDVQVLVARNDAELVGRKHLNVKLQARLNPLLEAEPTRRNPKFRRGDKVICLRNTQTHGHILPPTPSPHTTVASYSKTDERVYVANGDMGRVEACDSTSVIVRFFGPDRLVRVYTDRKKKTADNEGEKDVEFDLAYAVTVHKSQGSEWPVVIVVLDDAGGPIANREWLYTAISRAGKLCILVGKNSTAMKSIARVSLQKRVTFVKELIREQQDSPADGGLRPDDEPAAVCDEGLGVPGGV